MSNNTAENLEENLKESHTCPHQFHYGHLQQFHTENASPLSSTYNLKERKR